MRRRPLPHPADVSALAEPPPHAPDEALLAQVDAMIALLRDARVSLADSLAADEPRTAAVQLAWLSEAVRSARRWRLVRFRLRLRALETDGPQCLEAFAAAQSRWTALARSVKAALRRHSDPDERRSEAALARRWAALQAQLEVEAPGWRSIAGSPAAAAAVLAKAPSHLGREFAARELGLSRPVALSLAALIGQVAAAPGVVAARSPTRLPPAPPPGASSSRSGDDG